MRECSDDPCVVGAAVIDQRGIDQLKRHEGFRSAAYQDHLGYWTIGFGRMIDARRGGGISTEEAELMLRNDILRVSTALGGILEGDPPRRAVLVNMAFQLGVRGLFKFRRMLAAIERRDFEAAAREGLDSQWARQTPARARELMEQLRTGEFSEG